MSGEIISKLRGENIAINAEKLQQNLTESTIAIPILQSNEKERSSNSALKERYVQNWLIDSLPWIGRKVMADSALSTSNETFRQLCWPKLHQNVKRNKIPNLEFGAIIDKEYNFGVEFRRLDTKEIIPIASIPPPDYIDGIGKIRLKFLTEQVMNFFKCIDSLLQNCDLRVLFSFNSLEMDKKGIASMHALLEFLANKLFKFTFSYYERYPSIMNLNDFNRLFPGILDQIKFLSFTKCLDIDDKNSILLNWLTNQSNDGKQKIIQFKGNQTQEYMPLFISRVKEEFSNSNSLSNFLISFAVAIFEQNVEKFTLENARTNEILTFYRGRKQRWNNYYLARYPKGEEHWKEDWQNKIEKARLSNSVISI